VLKHFDIIVHGYVQGVYYRGSALKVAQNLGISGFVQNLSDGSVYIEAEGLSENLTEFIAWCRQGPAHARVERLEVTPGICNQLDDFYIKR